MDDSMNASLDAGSGLQQKKTPAKMIALGFLFILLILFFTLFKLPEARITALIQSQVQSQLDPFELYLTDRGRSLSLLTGIRYRLDHPTLELADQTRIELDDLEVKPKLLSLLTGRYGASASLHQGKSELTLDALARKDKIDADVDLTEVDLGKFGAFGFAGIKGSGLVSGKIHIDGAVTDLATLNGKIDLKLKNIHLDEQMLAAVALKIPEVRIPEGTILIEIKNGKLLMKTVQLGRQNDDLNATITGDIALNRNLNSSNLNIRATFGYSDRVRPSILFIEGMIAEGKQADGRYAYKLTGPLSNPMRMPDPAK